MNMLSLLREKNPGISIIDVFDSRFASYGRVLFRKDDAISKALERCPIPESGNCYVASEPALESLPGIAAIRRRAFGGMPVQAGYCNGRGFTINALEYHRCSEVNYSTTGLVLLLALPEQIRDRCVDATDVLGVYLPPETAVELWPRVLHFAPCRVSGDGFNCLVVLEQGTNAPMDHVDTAAEGEEALLWMQNKWLLCHPDSPQAANGAFVGIRGENLTVSI